ncbi:hypothetical protein [Glutamicibacter soli]|uniref:hypothetical protein n=1 Tax=Glutamicibacter soli TaxID=453836 RepID=UPI003FD67D09
MAAERTMAFWAKNSGDWIDMLPGSDKDTFAYLENAVARSPIWVVDDLAPSSNKRQVEMENQKLEDITRQIFNNTTKGRMNADTTSRKVNKPVAQLLIAAENELTVPSVREQLVPLCIGKGKLEPVLGANRRADRADRADRAARGRSSGTLDRALDPLRTPPGFHRRWRMACVDCESKHEREAQPGNRVQAHEGQGCLSWLHEAHRHLGRGPDHRL